MGYGPLLTIAIPTLNDHYGLWPTCQALRLYHAEAMRECELLIVDQDPDSVHGRDSAKMAKKLRNLATYEGAFWQVNYEAERSPQGIGPARNHVFRHAKGEWVLCIDSHIMFVDRAIDRLLEFVRENRESRNLHVAPLLSEGRESSDRTRFIGTHQDLTYRKQALGTWAHDPDLFDIDAPPKPVPMQGLGVFCCRKDAYPGFGSHQEGFGCGEAFFAERFRVRGDDVICLPFLQWVHRFFRPEEDRYPTWLIDKVRNGFGELVDLHQLAEPGAYDEGPYSFAEFVNHYAPQLGEREQLAMRIMLAEYLGKDPADVVDDSSGSTDDAGERAAVVA